MQFFDDDGAGNIRRYILVAGTRQYQDSTAGTITGTAVVGGTSSAAMNVAENTSVTIGTDSGYPISSLVITAPSGCTLEITGSIG